MAKQERLTPRQKRQADLDKGEERRRVREARREANREAEAGKGASEYALTRRLKAARRRAEKAMKVLERAERTISETEAEIVYDRAIEKTQVSSPTVPGAIDFVGKAVDVIEKLHRPKSGAPKIDKVRYRCAQEYKMAFDTLEGSIGGVMDFDRVRGGGGAKTPSDAEFVAGKKMREVEAKLDPLDVDLFACVIGFGLTLEEYGRHKFGLDPKTGKCRPRDIDYIERRIIDALGTLAAVWYPAMRERSARVGRDTIVTWMEPESAAAGEESQPASGAA